MYNQAGCCIRGAHAWVEQRSGGGNPTAHRSQKSIHPKENCKISPENILARWFQVSSNRPHLRPVGTTDSDLSVLLKWTDPGCRWERGCVLPDLWEIFLHNRGLYGELQNRIWRPIAAVPFSIVAPQIFLAKTPSSDPNTAGCAAAHENHQTGEPKR